MREPVRKRDSFAMCCEHTSFKMTRCFGSRSQVGRPSAVTLNPSEAKQKH